jgi:pimeloyl-ACP methyl ester carboxylesterase
VLLAGASHPWMGGVAWTNTLGGVPIAGHLFASLLVYPVGQFMIDNAIVEVFEPELPTPGYIQRTGVMLTLRPDNYLANAEDIRLLSDYLHDQSKRYIEIKQPVLIVHGNDDDVVPAWNHADRLIKMIPDIEIERLDGVGHALHHTHTEQINKLIVEFYDKVQIQYRSH